MSDIPAPLANGRYTLANTLGQGGMATVYGGFDTMLEVDRAVKVLSPALCRSEKLRKRFLAEARAMAKLRHTNIVTVFDVGVEDDTPYIVMEMVKGGAVIDLMERDGMLPADIAGPIMLGALAGLQASHDRGVVHRDIKPHNMLMTTDGIVKITDFGIAHMQEDERSFTKTGAVMGTLAYMPPEQRQSAKGLGPTADIFAAGASLYALLTGQEPFDLYNEALYAKLFEGVPGALSQIVARACSYAPEDRYQSCNEMSAHLFEALRELGVPVAPDYRVTLRENPDGTMYYDPDAPNEHAHSVPAAKVDSTTINPKDTWFTNSGERIGADPKFATTNPAERHIDRGSNKVMIMAIAVMIVVGLGAFFATSSKAPDTEASVAVEQPAEEPAKAEKATVAEEPAKAEEADKEEPAVAAVEEPVQVESEPATPAPTPAATPRTRTRTQPAARPPTPAAPAAQPTPPPPTPEPTPPPATTARRAAAPPPAPAPTGPGKLTLNSSPRSSVTINGVGVGQTWLRNHELEAGRTHRVVLQPTGGGTPKVLNVSLDPGERKVICWDFELGTYCPRR